MKTVNYSIKYIILQLNIHEKQWKLKPSSFKIKIMYFLLIGVGR
jgi:hypothetical protein